MNNPRVSIILPTYNGKKYILESLESIMDQTMRDFECIIVDDASTDGTCDLVLECIKDDDRFKLIRNETNQKLPNALNIGFREAKGEYLTWTSDDNRYLEDALKDMSEYLDENQDKMMVCAGMINIDEDGCHLYESDKYDDKTMMIGNAVGACFMYRRKVLDELGGYDDKYRYVEDYEYWLRILKNYGSIGYTDKVLYLYRRHGNSITGLKLKEIKNRHCELILNELEWILSRIKDDKTTVVEIYEFLLKQDALTERAGERMMDIVPQLKCIEKADYEKQIIFYGGGRVCDGVMDIIPREKISFIVDKKMYEEGITEKNGVPIISLEELARLQDDYQVVVTVGKKLKHEVICELAGNNIKKFCLSSIYLNDLDTKKAERG